MTVAEFWRQTPFETKLAIEAATAREKRAYRRELWAAWHVVWIDRNAVKRMPSLTDMLARLDKPAPKLTDPDEMLRQIVLINSSFGGADLRKH